MTEKDIAKFREILLEKKQSILSRLMKDGTRYHDIESTSGEGDMVDIANDSYEKYLLYDLSLNDKQELKEISTALKKIDDGTYGICESCGAPVPKQRLKIKPFAKYCISCREKYESDAS